jgi:formylglycine-generating enzyme required for sulfatase activity
MAWNMIKLFISYRSLDSAKVDKLVTRIASLKNGDGTPRYQIWQDKTSIPVGQDWWQAIVQGIDKCDVFVFMVSRESVQNVNCRDELTYARKRNRPIIPFVLEDEFYYNPANGKNNLNYWEHMPAELNDNRFQFLFYEGVSFAVQLNDAVDRLMQLGLRDIPVDFPADPRDKTSNDTIAIYDQACDYAHRLEFETARAKFQRLIDWQDTLFADDSHSWMVLLYEYEKLVRLDERKNTRHQIPPLWVKYEAQFPKPFIEGIFDPKDFKNRYNSIAQNNVGTGYIPSAPETKPAPVVQPPPVPVKQDPITIARAFKGKRNSDWKPIFQTFEVKGIQMEMCLVPPGSFQMGSNENDREKDIHLQTLTQPYWIGLHPVTNYQWHIAVEKSKVAVKVPEWADWYNDKAKTNHPVVGVTWYQCVEFLQWLGAEWRLPTEPEWEFAARGLDNLAYPFGNELKPDLVVYAENSNKSTAAVGARPQDASWVRAQDMSGNVWEWLSSIYEQYPYKADVAHENISSKAARVLRGGSWRSNPNHLRAAYRNYNYPYYGYNYVGFRCVCPASC